MIGAARVEPSADQLLVQQYNSARLKMHYALGRDAEGVRAAKEELRSLYSRMTSAQRKQVPAPR